MSNEQTTYHHIAITIVGSIRNPANLHDILARLQQTLEATIPALPDWNAAYPAVMITTAEVGYLTERPFDHERKGRDETTQPA